MRESEGWEYTGSAHVGSTPVNGASQSREYHYSHELTERSNELEVKPRTSEHRGDWLGEEHPTILHGKIARRRTSICIGRESRVWVRPSGKGTAQRRSYQVGKHPGTTGVLQEGTKPCRCSTPLRPPLGDRSRGRNHGSYIHVRYHLATKGDTAAPVRCVRPPTSDLLPCHTMAGRSALGPRKSGGIRTAPVCGAHGRLKGGCGGRGDSRVSTPPSWEREVRYL